MRQGIPQTQLYLYLCVDSYPNNLVFPMMPPRIAICAILIRAFAGALPAAGADDDRHLFGPYGIASTGADLLRARQYGEALRELESDTAVVDTPFHLFKLGLACAGAKEYSRALGFLRRAAAADPALAPVAYEKVGDIEYVQHRLVNALQAYRAAADSALNQRHQYYLYERMQNLALEHVDTVGRIPWLDEVLTFPVPGKPVPEAAPDSLAAALTAQNRAAVDSMVRRYFDSTTARAGRCAACSLLATVDSLPDTVISTGLLYRASVVAMDCGRNEAASDLLHIALQRSDFEQAVSTGKYLYNRGLLNYNLGNYNKAIRWFAKYEERHGLTPHLVYLVAKSYRSLGMGGRAAAWYDKHVRMYPHHPKTHDILWYRAWQREDAKDWPGARDIYRQIFTGHARGSKADDSYFRYALSYFRESRFDSSAAAFDTFVKKYPSSPLAPGGMYWKARCLYAANEHDKARSGFRAVADVSPLDYYAYRAVRMLETLGDTLCLVAIDTSFDLARTLAWLDSISAGARKPLTRADSTANELGRKLAFVGMPRHAEFLLEPIEVSYPGDLRLQFEISVLYQMCDDPGLSYRVGRRLAWRIPAAYRASMPAPVYRVLFPSAYRSIVEEAAGNVGISPALVWAITRQESTFDHLIVSPVGAIGLMQIMPYTGEEIARDLGEPFVLDSLYSPSTNVRYGAYYIKKVLDSFNGEIFKALAGYNGGPHNVRRWFPKKDNRGFDLLVEDVGYSETRDYVKRVLANYWTYLFLLEAEAKRVGGRGSVTRDAAEGTSGAGSTRGEGEPAPKAQAEGRSVPGGEGSNAVAPVLESPPDDGGPTDDAAGSEAADTGSDEDPVSDLDDEGVHVEE